MTIIRDPRNGDGAHIDGSYRLYVNAKSSPLQHIISEEEESAYQVEGEATWVAATGAQNVLFLTNTSKTKNIIVTYIRLQAITDLTLPNAGSFFTVEKDENYSSGGTEVTSANMNVGSANTASSTSYNDNPILSGTSVQLDKWRPKASGDVQSYNKEGVLILKPSKSIKISFTPAASHTATVYARISYIMEAPGD